MQEARTPSFPDFPALTVKMHMPRSSKPYNQFWFHSELSQHLQSVSLLSKRHVGVVCRVGSVSEYLIIWRAVFVDNLYLWKKSKRNNKRRIDLQEDVRYIFYINLSWPLKTPGNEVVEIVITQYLHVNNFAAPWKKLNPKRTPDTTITVFIFLSNIQTFLYILYIQAV